MPDYIRISSIKELPANGQAREFAVGEKMICLANVNGIITAMDNICVHRGGPLGMGVVEGGKVICPWHGWRYDPATGVPAENPQFKVDVYPLRVEGDDVFVKL